jgi:hypothetical protein
MFAYVDIESDLNNNHNHKAKGFLNHKECFSSTLLKYMKQGINMNKLMAFETFLAKVIF